MSIYGFLNVGAVEVNEVASALRRQNELLKKIEKALKPLRVIKNCKTSNRLYSTMKLGIKQPYFMPYIGYW